MQHSGYRLWVSAVLTIPLLLGNIAAGDSDESVAKFSDELAKNYPADLFADLTAGKVSQPNDAAKQAASAILDLQHEGKLPAGSPSVKRAFVYGFLTTYKDHTRLHEALALYGKIAVANGDDPFWRVVRARCARLMDLSETPQLYDQVAADMKGAPPDDEVRAMWESNRKEFDLDDLTKEAWARQLTRFVIDAAGPDVPGSPPIKGSPFPMLDLFGTIDSDVEVWNEALGASLSTHAKQFDDLAAQAGKFGELPWLDGCGYLNTERALASHLSGKPEDELAGLRTLQETGFKKSNTQPAKPTTPLQLFRRYPWSESAQCGLLQSARQQLFQGEAQCAFRSYQDVLRHAEAQELREQAQIGLWVGLSQFTSPERIARAFDGVNPKATWPWHGKRATTDEIKQQLVRKMDNDVSPPALTALKSHTIYIPPAQFFGEVSNVDMQAGDGHLLVSSPRMLAMYSTDDLSKPLWSDLKRMDRFTLGNAPYRPRFAGQAIITSYDNRMVALNRADGMSVGDGSPHDPHSLRLYRPTGSPLVADHQAFGVQAVQTSTILERWPPETRNFADIALSCFEVEGMNHRWTRVYDVAQTIGEPALHQSVGSEPLASDGAVYFCSNSGRVIRADMRDGELDWIHFFRPLAHPDDVPSEWNLGTSMIVTADRVICLPRFSGRPFALDKETGRCVWRTPLLRGRELLGIAEDLLLVVGDNSLYGIEVETGKMRWGQRLSEENVNGFQLPRAQLIGSSVYCGTKNSLQRFDARNGSLLESRPWNMGKERPMSFMIQATDLYVISDKPLRNEFHDRQLVDCYARGGELVAHREAIAMKRDDGTLVVWGDCMLICVKDGHLVWSRFVSNAVGHRSTLEDGRHRVRLSWTEASADHDMATGELLGIRRMPPINTGR
jgi:hypothetical protein